MHLRRPSTLILPLLALLWTLPVHSGPEQVRRYRANFERQAAADARLVPPGQVTRGVQVDRKAALENMRSDAMRHVQRHNRGSRLQIQHHKNRDQIRNRIREQIKAGTYSRKVEPDAVSVRDRVAATERQATADPSSVISQRRISSTATGSVADASGNKVIPKTTIDRVARVRDRQVAAPEPAPVRSRPTITATPVVRDRVVAQPPPPVRQPPVRQPPSIRPIDVEPLPPVRDTTADRTNTVNTDGANAADSPRQGRVSP